MRINSISITVIALALLCWPGAATSRAAGRAHRGKSVRVAILPVQVKDVSPKLGNRLGMAVFRELREIGVFRFISPKQTARKIRWMKKKRIFKPDCMENPKCVRVVGRRLRAKVIYFLMAAKAQKGVTLSMRTFDVKSGSQIRKDTEFAGEEPADLDRAARWLTRTVSGPMISTLVPGKGRLQVDCSVGGADLYLNGKSFGKRTGKNFKVGSGVFDIMVKKEGFTTYHEVVVVKPGQKKTIKAVIKSTAPEVPEVPEAVAAAIGSGEQGKTDATSAGTAKTGKKAKDLPAWAVFEKPKTKPQPIVLNKQGGKTSAAVEKMPWQHTAAKQPYLPQKSEPKTARAEKRRGSKFYETWWFWTLIGAGVAGAAGTTAYFLLAGGGGGAGTGSAIINWE